MTIHEEQPVAAEPRIDDENTADAVHEPEPATDEARDAQAPYASRNPLPMPSRRSRLGWTTNRQPQKCFSPATMSRICVRGGPAFRPHSWTIPRSASRRQTTWFPIWSSTSRPDSLRHGHAWKNSGRKGTRPPLKICGGSDALSRILRPLARRLNTYDNTIRFSAPHESHAFAGEPGIEVIAVAGEAVHRVHCALHGLLGDLRRQQIRAASRPTARRCRLRPHPRPVRTTRSR